MKKIIIKSMDIENFKGISKLKIEFDPVKNSIYGSNGSCKTSIKDAFEWAMCQNVQEIFPTFDNKEILGLKTKVELVLEVNEIEYVLERTSVGKYNDNVKIGNETGYKIDGFENKQKDYQNKVSETIGTVLLENLTILIDKDYFNENSKKWNWTNRRKFLLKMCGVENIVDEISKNEKYSGIREYVSKGYSTSDIKSMIEKEKRKLKLEQEKNLALITEREKELDELSAINFDETKKEIEDIKSTLNKLENQSREEIVSDELDELQKELLSKSKELSKIRTAETITITNMRKTANELYNECQILNSKIGQKSQDNRILLSKIENLKKESENIIEICPSCKQKLPIEEVENVKFEIKKQCEDMEKQSEKLEREIAELKKLYIESKKEYDVKEKHIKDFVPNNKIKELETSILETQRVIEDIKGKKSNTLSLEKKNVLEGELEALYAKYSKKQFLEDGVNKINLWKKSSLEIAERLREYELELKSLNEFVKEQTEMTSKIINKNFDKDINWKLYDIGYNGELSETCKLNYKGKPYQVLSTGEKAFVNLKCIETIQNFLDINMCIFIDNAEGITIPFNTNMQTIELYVKKGAKIQDIIKISDIYKKYNKGEK